MKVQKVVRSTRPTSTREDIGCGKEWVSKTGKEELEKLLADGYTVADKTPTNDYIEYIVEKETGNRISNSDNVKTVTKSIGTVDVPTS